MYGDLVSTMDAETICAALEGCRYERESVLASLSSHGMEGAVYRITAEEMASAVVD